jgi:hypothetical protein
MRRKRNRRPTPPPSNPGPSPESTLPPPALSGNYEHREIILRSELCGCQLCRHLFRPDEIEEWIDETDGVGQTALCPKCGLDAVIGSASPFPEDLKLLSELARRWGAPFPP